MSEDKKSRKGKSIQRRIDQLLVVKGLFSSRTDAQKAILAGQVRVGTRVVQKSNEMYSENVVIEIIGRKKFVSRGGDKIEGAIRHFAIDCRQKVCIDVGCSTGGFTDCLLKDGAEKIYAIDVGYGQMALELRNHPNVILKEKTNARYLRASDFPEKIDLAVIDVSFISLEKILPAIFQLMNCHGNVLALIKPQFEAGRENLTKGVVKDESVRKTIVQKISSFAQSLGWSPSEAYLSPLAGPAGNREYFIYLQKTGPDGKICT